MFSFASTTLILSLYNCNAHGTSASTPNVVVGMALFCGGLAQLLAGMWEFAVGNTFGATGGCLPLLFVFPFFSGFLALAAFRPTHPSIHSFIPCLSSLSLHAGAYAPMHMHKRG